MGAIKVILNPVAGRGYGGRAEPELREWLKAEGVEFDLVRTARPGHAAELAEQAVNDGFGTVVAAGGDGTSNEVLNGLMAAAQDGRTAVMGFLPLGSGCDFANTMGISGDLRAACRKLAGEQTRMMDVGRVTIPGRFSSYFGNFVGIGFDAVVTRETRKVKWLRGMALYLPVVLKTVFLYYKAPRVKIEYDGQELSLPALMICVTNGPREGGGFFVAPEARPDDGLFDLCAAREVPQLQILRLIPRFMNGSHVNHEAVTMSRARHVVVSSPDSLVAHMDGEVICEDAQRIECEILPGRLQVRG
jgi:YegS/Rv2252/BmrU family lipid kinase